jgi:hypothetical protein
MPFYVFLLSSSSHQNKQPAIVPPGKYSVTEQKRDGYSDVTPNVINVDTGSGDVSVKFVDDLDELPSSAPSVSSAPVAPV